MSVSVLGGGIGGLSAAYYLSLSQNFSRQIKLYEASTRFGGWIHSKKYKDGIVFETGPRSLRPVGEVGLTSLELIERLGMKENVLPVHKTHVAAKNRMIFAKDQLCKLPNSFGMVLKKIPPFSKPLVFAGLKDLFTGRSKTPLEDETIYDFFARRFGPEIAKYVISPVICGICAGDAREISVKFLFKDIFEKEQKYGGIIKGVIKGKKDYKVPKATVEISEFMKRSSAEGWSMYRIQDGIENIPRSIIKELQGNSRVDLNLNSPCDAISVSKNEATVSFNGEKQKTDHIISTLPAFALAGLLRNQHPFLADELAKIQYVDVAVINLLYSKENLLKEQGFGVLVAPSENLPILGIIFDSCIADSKGNTVLTVMSGGRFFDKFYKENSSKEFILKTALENVGKILKIQDKPDHSEVYLHRQCIPQYTLGHHARVEKIRKYIADNELPLSLGGAAFDGVGVNDVIYSSKSIANQLSV